MDTPEERTLTTDVFEALDLSPEQFLTDGGLVNRGKLRAAFWYPHDYLPEGHWMRAADEGRLRAENAALKHDLQYARDGLTKGRSRMREDIARLRAALDQKHAEYEDLKACAANNARNLAREAHTWRTAARDAAKAELERLRALLRQALDALEVESAWGGPTPKGAAAIASLREALGPNT